jgi:hypothetical protein
VTPSTTIRDQTLRALKRPTHPYREALQHALNRSVEVVTLEEALTMPRSVQSEAALVIVTTIQSYRIRDERSGEELAATRRIYRDDVVRTAVQLRDRMVETCGFDERSVEDAVRVTAAQTQRGLGFGRIPLTAPPRPDALPVPLARDELADRQPPGGHCDLRRTCGADRRAGLRAVAAI